MAEPTDGATQFAAFMDEFVSGGQQERVSDISAVSFANELAATRRSLTKLRAIDPATLSVADRIDWKFAQSILVGRELQQAQMQAWTKDPRVYMRFRSIPIAIGRPGNLAKKSDSLLELVTAVPVQLKNARANLASYVPRFQELSVFMAGALGTSSIRIFLNSPSRPRSEPL